MSRAAMQMALEALEWNYNTDLDNIPACEQWAKMLNETIAALRAALAEPDSDYERGFVDGMNLQTKGSVDKAVNHIAESEQPVGINGLTEAETDASASVKGLVGKPEQIGNARCPRCWEPITAPTPRKPLTDDEIALIVGECAASAHQHDDFSFARAIERAHGIGEQHE